MIRQGKVDDEALHFTKHRGARDGLVRSAIRRRGDDDAVVVAVGDLAGDERHAAEGTATSRSPSPVLVPLRGLVPSALIPMSMVRSAAASRTAPLTISPAQPL